MKFDSIVPLPKVDYRGETINGRLIGEPHYEDKYWKWDWICVVHDLKSERPMRIKDMRNKKGPRCCYNQKMGGNAAWKGYNTLSLTKFNTIKNGAKNRGHEFNVSMEFLWNLWDSQGRKCAYTNRSLSNINKASLDRIDSKIGYVPGNIEWVHVDVNLAKQRLSRSDFISLCIEIANSRPIPPLDAKTKMVEPRVDTHG